MATAREPINRGDGADGIPLFPGFARLWACATLIHQLAFTFWAESWPGWLLVLCAVAVLFQPACLLRFAWLVVAALLNLFNKLPFVPNHVLFEGMLHLTMVIAIGEFLIRGGGWSAIRSASRPDSRTLLLVTALGIKALYHLQPFFEENYLLGSLSTALMLCGVGVFLFGRPPVVSGEPFLLRVAPVLRYALLITYFWAAVQKLNFDYLDPAVSCAAQLHVEIARYFGPLVPTATWALHAAIWGSLFFEIAIPLLLFNPKTRLAGFVAAVWFHLWLSIHPAAGIYSFTSLILAMLYLFLPVGMREELHGIFKRQLRSVGGGDADRGQFRTNVIVTACFFAALSTQIAMYLLIDRSYEVFDRANRVGFAVFFAWGLWLGGCYLVAGFRSRQLADDRLPTPARPTLAWVGLILVLANGFSPWVGGKTQTSFSMYSNLRSEGEGNHLFLRRIDLLPFQRDMITVTRAEPSILDPSPKPSGIRNFANPGHSVLPYFELRRLLSEHEGDFEVEYEHQGELKLVSRRGAEIDGDTNLIEPIPLLARKFLWFRRLNSLSGPMPCTH